MGRLSSFLPGKDSLSVDVTSDLARLIDHTLLKPDATSVEIQALCDEAARYNFHAVCVNPIWVKVASQTLAGTMTRVCSVIAFPLGATRTETKVQEALRAVGDGAAELDVVAFQGAIIAGNFEELRHEVTEIRKRLPTEVVLKVIVEAGLLNEIQQKEATDAVVDGGADFIKTGTGFFGPVSRKQLVLLNEHAQGRINIKASGGIKSLSQVREMLQAGAHRIGSSSSVRIMQELDTD